MVFSSLVFISIFLPVVFLLHQLLPGIRGKNAMLLMASLLFYAYGEPVYIFLMIFCALLNYFLAGKIAKHEDCGIRKRYLIFAITANLLILGIFKYLGFLVTLWNDLLGQSVPVPQLALPIGISFFTFQAMSYVIDVYRKETPTQKNFAKVLLYISFFPQLIAGPIVRYRDIEEQLSERSADANQIASGLQRFLFGLAKKVLIANQLAVAADHLFAAGSEALFVGSAWIGAVSYMLQIYFDFSGYSDMAIGMGRMFGFTFCENFDHPYLASSVREFWRKWHMSLTSWFREYLYIPLGGNRKGKRRTVWNRMIVFLCTGIWHGANLTYLFWGIYHGILVSVEVLLERGREDSGKRGRYAVLGHIYTLLAVCVGFVFFRADTIAEGMRWIREMFFGFHFERGALSLAMQQLTPWYLICLAAGVICCFPAPRRFREGKNRFLAAAASVVLLVLCMLQLASDTYNPFIYFQF